MNCCPSREELQKLLAEQLIEAQQETIEIHVEACAACRQTLARLSERGEELNTQLFGSLSAAPLAPSDRDFVRRLKEHPPPGEETAFHEQEESQQSPITFPGPPSEKGPLGQLDGFAIRKELGAGRFGVVYQAYDELDRLVAIKVLKPELAASSRERTRFEHEACKAAAVKHDHIITIHQVGRSVSFALPYLVMEYVDGEALSDRLQREGVMEPREAARMVRQMALALAAAHARGLIHRDIKPSNILLEAGSGRAKLTDFGLARLADAIGGSISQSGRIVGTPAYMSPEQIASPAQVDGRSDVYSLGVVLYELLTGERPFRGNTHLLLQEVVHDEPRSPRKLNDSIPRDLETICLKAMSKAPGRRYATALDLAEDLRRFLVGEPIQARPVANAEKWWRWCRRNPALATLGTCVAVLLVSVAVVSSLAALRLERAERDKTEKLWQSYLDQARARRSSHEAGQRFVSLKKLREAASIVRSLNYAAEVLAKNILELRNEAIGCMLLPDVRVLRTWPVNLAPGSGVAFDSRLERYAHSDIQGNIVVRQVADHTEILPLPGTGGDLVYTGCRLSPDGRYLAAHYFMGKESGQIVLWDLEAKRKVLDAPSWVTSECFDFSADSRWLAAAGPEETIDLYDCARGQKLKSLGRDLKPSQMAFDPSSRKLAVTSAYLPVVQIWDVEKGDILATLPHSVQTLGIAWSPQGRYLAVSCLDAKIYVWDLVKRQQPTVLEGHQAHVTRLAFNHAGDLLVSRSDDGTTRFWDPIRATHLFTMAGCCDRIGLDDRRLASWHGDQLSLLEMADRHELLEIPGAATTLDFSPEGAFLATAGCDGVRLCDVSSAREVADLSLDHCETASFHPNGRSLVTYGKASGLLLWPLRDDSRGPIHSRQVGPPQALEKTLIHGWQRAHWSSDGRLLAVADNRNKNAFILTPERPGERQFLGGFPNLATIALSPDGQWAAAGAVVPALVRIWNVPSNQAAHDFPGWNVPSNQAAHDFPGYSEAAFSPDGRSLITGSRDEYCLWRVGTWEAGWRLPRDQRVESGFAPAAFSKDGQLLAVARSPQRIQLVHPATGQEIATLAAPSPSAITSLCFSPDSSRLGVANGREGVHLWDLRAIRQQLAALGLDWSLPPYPPANEIDTAKAMHVEVLQDRKASWRSYWLVRGRTHQQFGQPSEAVIDFTEALKILPPDAPPRQRAELLQMRARNLIRIRGYDAALADMQKALELAPDSPTACHELARLYVTGPERLRNPRKAWRLALQAVNLRPGEWAYRSTLGIVYYRLALYPQALETLERSLRESKGESPAPDLFFLAMCHARLGQVGEAKKCFDHTAGRMQESEDRLQPHAKQELDALRAEAQELLQSKSPLLNYVCSWVACFRGPCWLGISLFAMQGRESMAPDPANPATASKTRGMLKIVPQSSAGAVASKIPTFGHTGPISSVALSEDGQRVLTGAADQTAILWDAQSGTRLRTFNEHTDVVSSVALSRDGKRVLTGSFDFTAVSWDASSSVKLHTFAEHTREVVSVAFSRDGQRVLTGSWDQTAILWDANSGAKLQSFSGHSSVVTCVAMSADGRRVITGSADHTAILWDAETGARICTFTGHTGTINSVAMTEDGQRVLTGSSDHSAILWDVSSRAKICTFAEHSDEVLAAVLSRDGHKVLTGSADHTAILWDIQSCTPLHRFVGHADQVRSVALSGDGRRVLTGSLDHAVILWDAQTGAQLRTFAERVSKAVGRRIKNQDGYNLNPVLLSQDRNSGTVQPLFAPSPNTVKSNSSSAQPPSTWRIQKTAVKLEK